MFQCCILVLHYHLGWLWDFWPDHYCQTVSLKQLILQDYKIIIELNYLFSSNSIKQFFWIRIPIINTIMFLIFQIILVFSINSSPHKLIFYLQKKIILLSIFKYLLVFYIIQYRGSMFNHNLIFSIWMNHNIKSTRSGG